MKVARWQMPWPMIQISESEWVIMRDHPARPAALVRHLDQKRDDSCQVVRWAPMGGQAVVRILSVSRNVRHGGDIYGARARHRTASTYY